MLTPARVLCVGYDKLLLQTRKLVLERHFSVETAVTLQGLTLRAAGESIALVILCHSVSREERVLAAAIVKETWPQARILEVLSSRENEAASENSEIIFGLDGPASLLKRAMDLVGAPSMGSKTLPVTRRLESAPGFALEFASRKR